MSEAIALQLDDLVADGRYSQLVGCIDAATDTYRLSKSEAKDMIRSEWDEAADVARLTAAERDQLWRRQILNPYALESAA